MVLQPFGISQNSSLASAQRPTLYPQNAEYISIEAEKIHQACNEYFNMYLCKVPTVTTPSCISHLFRNKSTHCSTSSPLFTPILQPVTKIHLFFFQHQTDALIQCGKEFARVMLQGLVQVQDRPGCQLITSDFSYTFLGTDPQEIFNQEPIRIVDNIIMPNVSQDKQDEFDKSLEDLSKDITDFEESSIDSSPVAPYTILDYANLGMTILALLLAIGLLVFFVYRCRKILAEAVIPAIVPPAAENEPAANLAPGLAPPL